MPFKTPSRLTLTAVAFALTAGANASLLGQPAPARRTAGVVAIKGATILTVTKGTIPNGTIVLRDGKIAAVGAAADVPAGAEVVDATGKYVSPGIIDAHSHIAADSINEGGTTVSSMTGIEDVLDPTDINIYRDLAGGLTTANVLHGSANPIGGKNAVIKLRWGKTRAEELLFEGAMPGIKFALGENPKDMRQFGQTGPRRYPITREGVEFVIRDAFTRAKAYQRAWREYEKKKAAGQDVVAPARDLQLEPLVEILEGKRLVHAHCYRADEILMLLRLADEMGFKIQTLQHVLEGYKVAKEIAAHGAGASSFSDWWGYKIEAEDAIPHNATIMVRKGVLVSINSDSAEHARRLNTEAAKSVKWGGLTDDEAFALVTINPAKQLKIDNRVGSLEQGKDADVVIWSHHPLSSYAIAERTYIDGIAYYDRIAEERRLTDMRKEKEGLLTAEKQDRRAPTANEAQEPPKPRDATVARPKEEEPNGNGNGTGNGNGHGTTPTVGTTGAASSQQPAQRAVWAITNARIHPVTKPVIERGTIVIRGSKIEAVGAGVSVPAGAKTIDAAGADVYPGFINARTTLGLAEPGPRGFDDVSEMLDFNPELRAVVAYQADSDAIPVARANGVTTVAVVPTGGILGGQVAVMNLDGWTWEEAAIRQTAGVSFTFPTIGRTGFFFGPPPSPQEQERTYDDLKKERDQKLERLARLLDDARAYAKVPKDQRLTNWSLEALVPIVEKKAPLFVAANREADIRDAVAFADRVKVNMILTGGLEAPLVAPLLKEKNIPVILGSVLTLPSREDMFHAASYQAAGELAQAGIKFAFATGDNTNVRLVPYNAAISVAWGLPHEEAIKALTINAADILGVADRMGSIEPGKDANLLVSKGDPLEIRTTISHVVIAGKNVDLDNKHQTLFERFMARP
ncbi:MAG TPA: amidohydrolase family protein [Vicinamibacterales bacterium]|nr:amidohydrolase family protein [Vicinamibacterales bacterium]